MVTLEQIKQILGEVLQLGGRTQTLTADTTLLGGIPEFDSMAVVSVLTSIEERYGVIIDDDEISADDFATVGSLHAFILGKVQG